MVFANEYVCYIIDNIPYPILTMVIYSRVRQGIDNIPYHKGILSMGKVCAIACMSQYAILEQNGIVCNSKASIITFFCFSLFDYRKEDGGTRLECSIIYCSS